MKDFEKDSDADVALSISVSSSTLYKVTVILCKVQLRLLPKVYKNSPESGDARKKQQWNVTK